MDDSKQEPVALCKLCGGSGVVGVGQPCMCATPADPKAAEPVARPDSPTIDYLWANFRLMEEYQRCIEWGQTGDIEGALFVAFREGVAARHPDLRGSTAPEAAFRRITCPFCEVEFVDGALHDANLEIHLLKQARTSTAVPQDAPTLQQQARDMAEHLRSGNWNLRAPQEMADMIATWFDALAAAPQVPLDAPTMPQYWSVEVRVDGDRLVSIGPDWLSGSRALEQIDEQHIIGAAKHLLAFVGYGLPPSGFDPDAAPNVPAAEADKPVALAVSKRDGGYQLVSYDVDYFKRQEEANGTVALYAAPNAKETP